MEMFLIYKFRDTTHICLSGPTADFSIYFKCAWLWPSFMGYGFQDSI